MESQDQPEFDELGELVIECLELIEVSGIGAVEEVCRRHPERAGALRSRMRTLVGTGLLETDADVPERLGDFRLLHRLGAGGMGVVYAARQESLDRDVALKLVRPDQLFFPEARERFRREVAVVARLQHPGIVPVYTVGEERGIPYFAMELQRGATLAEVLADVQGRQPRAGRDLALALANVVERRGVPRPDVGGELFDGSWSEACLRILSQVARALESAHRSNVLHRDLKPSNIMLTTDGRALLFDFGLASSRDAARVTRTGSQVGSLAYMSPEQLRGDPLDVRTDVYGLGATLCELLTLQPPHRDLRGAALVQAILRGEPVEVRALNRAVSRDVDTLCRKALEGDPSRRYASAALLASDLDNVLARRPIAARRTGPLRRATRWAQRHPARAVALMLAIGAPAAFALQRDHASSRIAEQRDRAEANLDRAVRAIEVFLWEVGAESLDGTPHMEATRLRLLEEALALMRELTPQRPDDPAQRQRWVRVQRSMGDVLAMLDRLPEAEVCFRSQLEVLRDVQEPTAEQRDDLAGCLNVLGNALLGQGRQDEAVAAYEEARDLLLDRNEARALDRLTTVQRNLGNVFESRGDGDAADLAYSAAADAAEHLLEFDAEANSARSQLGKALLARAILNEARGARPQAIEFVRRALGLLVACSEADPDDPEARAAAAAACMNAGAMERPADAEPILRTGLGLAGRLVADHPATPSYARTLSSLHQNLGLTLRALGRWDEAEVQLLSGLRTIGETTESHPDVVENQLALGLAGTNMASLLVELGRRAEACEPGARAVQAYTRALTLQPGDGAIEHALAWAGIQEAYGRAARGEIERVEVLLAPLAELAPDDPGVAIAQAELLALCAALDAAGAADFERRALDALEAGLALGFRDLAYLRGSVELRAVASSSRFDELLTRAEQQLDS